MVTPWQHHHYINMARKREITLSLRLSNTEYDFIEREANRRQMSKNELLRDLLKALEREVTSSKVG